jgi:hypothetical protein
MRIRIRVSSFVSFTSYAEAKQQRTKHENFSEHFSEKGCSFKSPHTARPKLSASGRTKRQAEGEMEERMKLGVGRTCDWCHRTLRSMTEEKLVI